MHLESRAGKSGRPEGLEVGYGCAAAEVEAVLADAFVAGARALDGGYGGQGVLDGDALAKVGAPFACGAAFPQEK